MMKVKTFVLKMFLLFISLGIAICSYQVSQIQRDYKVSENTYKAIEETAVKKNEKTMDGEDEKSPPFSVDFKTLKQINSDIVGWLHIENTAISYPVVKGEDNTFYLSHLPNKNWSSSGTLFMDCRNKLTDKHLLIYGHNMKNGSMFAELSHYSSQDFYNTHKKIYLFTEEKTYELKIHSAYYTTDSDFTYSLESSSENALEYSYYAKHHSCIDTDAVFDTEDTMVTLSTCAYLTGYNRFVVQCVLERS